MTPNQSASQETLIGSPAAPRPNGVDSGLSYSTQSDNLRRVTPEFQQQVALEVRVIDANVQLKVKNAIIQELLSPVMDDEGVIALGVLPEVNDAELIEQVVTPQLKDWQKEKLELAVYLVGNRIPYTKNQLRLKKDSLTLKQNELTFIEKQRLEQYPDMYAVGQRPSVLRAITELTKTVKELPVDIDNLTSRAHSAEGVFAHLRDILADEEVLADRYAGVIQEAKLDAYFEVIDAMEHKKALIDDTTSENVGIIQDLAHKIHTLRAELKAMMDIAGYDVSSIELEDSSETPEKPKLTRILGSLGIKGLSSRKVALAS